jgi:hypothetical protein
MEALFRIQLSPQRLTLLGRERSEVIDEALESAYDIGGDCYASREHLCNCPEQIGLSEPFLLDKRSQTSDQLLIGKMGSVVRVHGTPRRGRVSRAGCS